MPPEETKTQANTRILNEAKVSDNEVSKINIRHTDSCHPIDCSCTPCQDMRFTFEDNKESAIKNKLNLYNNNKPYATED
jgi:hypothetical protein